LGGVFFLKNFKKKRCFGEFFFILTKKQPMEKRNSKRASVLFPQEANFVKRGGLSVMVDGQICPVLFEFAKHRQF